MSIPENTSVLPTVEQKSLLYFKGICEIFSGISKILFISSMISRETSNDVPRNPGWETLS